MMRLASHTSVLVACSLLALVATVHAECAWLLWHNSVVSVPGKDALESQSFDAFPTYAACHQALARFLRAEAGNPGNKIVTDTTGASRGYYFTEVQGISRGGNLACLPDTVDPRGVKGK
jgi:hypothetical protein